MLNFGIIAFASYHLFGCLEGEGEKGGKLTFFVSFYCFILFSFSHRFFSKESKSFCFVCMHISDGYLYLYVYITLFSNNSLRFFFYFKDNFCNGMGQYWVFCVLDSLILKLG